MARKSTSSTAKSSSAGAETTKTGTVTLKAVAPTARPKIVTPATPVVAEHQVKKPEFLERALARTDIKRRDGKPAMEAALAELAAILLDGNEVNVPPMGKIKVVKSKDVGDGAKVLTLKMRTMKDGAGQGAAQGVTED